MLHLDFSKIKKFVTKEDIESIKNQAEKAKAALLDQKGAGSDYLGWVDWPVRDHRAMLDQIKTAAQRIRQQSEILIVIGIGGSFLGAAAAVDFLKPYFYNQFDAEKRSGVEIYFAGHQISGGYIKDLLQVIGERDFSVNVISKSGTTTEPGIAFRLFKQILEERYGRTEAAKRIYATTDRHRGALKQLADLEGYETFVIPDDIGGRYSVLTPVGLLPIAAAGGNIDELLAGSIAVRGRILDGHFESDPAMQYAVLRQILYRQGKKIELLSAYEPKCRMIGEWWKQLFGESEGKSGRGLFPATYQLTTDLHSLGQYVQDGERILFETVLNVRDAQGDVMIAAAEEDIDGLNYLAGKTLEEVNKNAMMGAMLAHIEGDVPNLMIEIDDFSAFSLGELFYFFEFACGISGYMLGVNPFDQPGVEAYKRNMFKLLGKPGCE